MNHISWSPYGRNFVMAALTHGEVMFCTLAKDHNKHRFELYHRDEHFCVTDVLWDPTSRYVITAVTQNFDRGGGRYMSEAGYAIWTFQGRQIFKTQRERLWGISWRPHPPSLLPQAKIKDIQDNLKEYAKKYDLADEASKDVQRKAIIEKKTNALNDFLSIVAEISAFREEEWKKTSFQGNWQKMEDSVQKEIVEETVETEISKVEEPI